mgnify:CR=1 FL=1
MANNPLYPGYTPGKKDEESINPLYPGYYAGKPLQNRPQSKNFIKPIEFDMDIIMEDIDNIAGKAIEAPLAGPKWVKKRIMDDWKNKLKVSVSSSHNLDVTELDDYSVADFPGVSIALSLNPDDWGLNPKDDKEIRQKKFKKQLKKTINSWTKETTGIDPGNLLKPDFSDFSNAQEEWAWNRVMGYGETSKSGLTPTEKLTIETTEKHISAPHPDYWEEKSPLNIKGVDVKVKRKGEVHSYSDIYRDTAQAVEEFEHQKDNVKKRDEKYNGIMKNASDAVSKELDHHYLNSNDNVKKIYDSHAGAMAFFDIQKDTVKSIYDTDKVVKTKKGSFNKIKGKLEQARVDHNKNLNRVEVLYKEGKINNEAYNRFVQNSKVYDKYLSKRISTVENAIEGKLSSNNALKILGDRGFGRKLTNTETFNESVVGGFQKGIENSILGTREGDIGNLLRDPELKSAGVNLRAKALIPIIDRTRQDRIYKATSEILDAWDEENLLERYAWKAVKQALPERLEAFTNGDFIEKRLEKTNHFGLKVAVYHDGSAKSLQGVTDPNKIARFNKKYGYKVGLGLDKELFGTNKLELKGGGREFSLLKTGSPSQYFDFENKDERVIFAKLLNGNKSDQLKSEISELVSKNRFGVSFSELDKSQKSDISKVLFGELDYQTGVKKEEGLYDQAKYFREWVKENLGDSAGPDSPMFIPSLPQYKVSFLENEFLRDLGITDVVIKRADLDALKIFSNSDLNIIDFTNKRHTQQIKKMLTGKAVSLDDVSKVFFNTSKFQALDIKDQEKLLGMVDEFADFSKWIETLPEDVRNKLFNGTSRLEFFKALKDSDFKEKFMSVNLDNLDEFKKWLGNLPEGMKTELLDGKDPEEFFNLLKKLKHGEGDKYTDTTDDTAVKFLLFQQVQKKNSELGAGYKLTDRKYIGKLERVHKSLQELQTKISKSFLGKTVRFLNNWRDIIAKKASELVIKAVSKLLSSLLGVAAASTGVLAAIMPVIKAVAEKVIKKALVYGEATLKALFKLDTTELEKIIAKDMKKLLTSCLVIGTIILSPIILVSTMFFMVIGASISPADMSEVEAPDFGQQAENYTRFSLGTCTLTPEVLADAPRWYYSQCDPMWSDIQIDSSPYSVGSAGCTLTTVAMVYKYFDYGCVDPEVVVTTGPFGPSGNIPSHDTDDWDTYINGGCIPASGSGITSEVNIGVGGKRVGSISILDTLNDWFSIHPEGLISLGMTAPPDKQHWVILQWDGSNVIIIDPYPTVNSPAVSTFPGAFEDWTAATNTTGYYVP